MNGGDPSSFYLMIVRFPSSCSISPNFCSFGLEKVKERGERGNVPLSTLILLKTCNYNWFRDFRPYSFSLGRSSIKKRGQCTISVPCNKCAQTLHFIKGIFAKYVPTYSLAKDFIDLGLFVFQLIKEGHAYYDIF